MKKLAMGLILVIPMTSSAQNYMEMNQADLEKMLQQVDQIQSCLEKIDQSQLKALDTRTQKMEAEVQSLCASGKRDAAQAKAIAYGNEIRNDSTMRMLAECGGMMEDATTGASYTDLQKAGAEYHICD